MAGTAKLAAAAATKLIAREPRDGCGYCRRTLSADVRIECSVCTPRLLLCVECFHAGVVIHTRGHTSEHGYRVIDVGREALLEVGWLAGDELKLLEAMQLYGFGNWADIASHVGGGRTRAEVESHYRRCYLESPNFPEPNFERLGHTPGKRMKLEAAAAPPSAHMLKAEDAARASAAAALAAAGGQAFVPGPNPAEVAARPPEAEYAYAGWMPLRGEFDTEWEDDAEVQVSQKQTPKTKPKAGEGGGSRPLAGCGIGCSEAAGPSLRPTWQPRRCRRVLPRVMGRHFLFLATIAFDSWPPCAFYFWPRSPFRRRGTRPKAPEGRVVFTCDSAAAFPLHDPRGARRSS